MGEDLARAGVVAQFGMIVSLAPLLVACIYLVRPTERLLSQMRPLSLATIFAALQTLTAGLAAAARNLPESRTASGYDVARIAHGISETLAPVFVAFGFLAAAWLLVAVGMRRHT